MSNRIYNIVIDGDFDENLQLFAKNLSPDEEIVSTATIVNAGSGDRLVVCTRKKETKNLLLEETKGRQK